ncbi:MAG TPA: hypothetical protein VE263_15115 [Candidatus Angelobacter sp.]|nr:hypothetical protein [Candidatus Angelobacter sp.]
MNWGFGPSLGILTASSYLFWLAAAALVWRHRQDFFTWVEDEFALFRRNFSRHTPVGPFYCPRGDSRLNAFPVSFLHSVKHFPRRRANTAMVLLLVGVLLFFLDFYI